MWYLVVSLVVKRLQKLSTSGMKVLRIQCVGLLVADDDEEEDAVPSLVSRIFVSDVSCFVLWHLPCLSQQL